MVTVFRHRLQHLVCQMQDCVTLNRDKVHDEEAAHITPPHNTVFLQYSQYSARSNQ